jgi:ubiquinone/menaquinone biosynthesis C-methylase UbiE
MQEIVYHTNYELEDTYWWFVARNKVIYNIVKNKTDLNKGDTILDAGCGTGGFSKYMSRRYKMIGLDTSSTALEYARKRGLVNLFHTTLDKFPKDDWDVKAITMLDVIEHIDDDRSAVRQAYEILQPGGWLIASVPAFMWLWSNHDEMHMHKRRYVMSRFRDMITASGFEIEYSTYFNTLLFLQAAAKRMFNRMFQKEQDKPVDELPKFLNNIFTKVFSAEALLLPGIKFPFGLSIICIARKPD